MIRDLRRGKSGGLLLSLAVLIIFSIPFNFSYLVKLKSYFGELYYLAYFYLFLVLLVLFVIQLLRKRIVKLFIDPTYLRFLILFLLSLVFSTVANYSGIVSNAFKGRSGSEKFILQMITAFLIFMLIAVMYNVLVTYRIRLGYAQVMDRIYRAMDVMLVFMVPYCLLQYLDENFLRIPGFHQVDFLIHGNGEGLGRVRFVSFEVAQFGLFMAILLPFLYIRIQKEPGKLRNWATLPVFFFIIGLSGSRSAIANAAAVTGVFLVLAMMKMQKKNTKYLAAAIVCFILIVAAAASDYIFKSSAFQMASTLISYKGTTHEESNTSRYGMVNTGLSMVGDNPWGVGIGQFAFNFPKYARFGSLNYEIKQWLSPYSDLWPTILNFYIRLATELGLLGLLSFLFLWFSLLKRLFSLFRRCRSDYYDLELSILLIVGCLATGFQIDSWTNSAIWFSTTISTFVLYHCQKDTA